MISISTLQEMDETHVASYLTSYFGRGCVNKNITTPTAMKKVAESEQKPTQDYVEDDGGGETGHWSPGRDELLLEHVHQGALVLWLLGLPDTYLGDLSHLDLIVVLVHFVF